MGTIYIDDQPVEFEAGDNVLQAALGAGIEAPYFCYHEALGSAGSCRVCAMELEPAKEGEHSRVVMTCMQLAQNGQRYRLNKGSADKVRKNVVEYYMTRHPHDCPVCDEAGECHLQDMTILSHQSYRRYDGKKRTFPNQPMGPLVWNIANRCITCYRCVRFYQNYALGDDFGVYGSGQNTTFRRSESGHFDSPFSGNIIDVCPTGTFTDKLYRRKYSRTWQLEKAASVCGHCSVGCNTEPGGREGTLRRIHPRANREINPHFICDRGRYGEHFSEAPGRPVIPQLHNAQEGMATIYAHVKKQLQNARGKIAVISSTNEDIDTHRALKSLANYYGGLFSPFTVPATENITRAAIKASMFPPSLVDIEKADGAFIVGSLTEAAPMMDLAVRQLIAGDKPVYMIHAAPSLLADLIRQRRSGYVRHIAPGAWTDTITEMNTTEEIAEMGPNLFANLNTGNNVVVLGVADEMDTSAIHALHELACGLERKQLNVQLGFALDGANAAGAVMTSEGNSAQKIIDAIRAGQITTLVVCGADPFGHGGLLWQSMREKITELIVLDNVATETINKADVVLPMATWSERGGLSMNYEGRLQSFKRAYRRDGVISAVEFVSAVTTDTMENFCRDRDAWVLDVAGKMVMTGQSGTRVDFNKLLTAGNAEYSDTVIPGKSTDKKEGEGLQIVRLPWHGGGDKADYAADLVSIKPWSNGTGYIHPDTAEKLSLETGRKLYLNNGFTLIIMHSCRVARGCLAITRKTLTYTDYRPADVLYFDRMSNEE